MKTKHKDFRDDDSDSVKDRLFEPVQDSMDGYLQLYRRIAERAHRHGICSFVVVSTADPLTDYSDFRGAMRGNRYQNLGAARRALRQFEED